MAPKIVPWWLPRYYNHKEGPISGGRFLDPKNALQGLFFRTLFLGLKLHLKRTENLGEKQKHIHQSIHPENASLPHLGIAVAGHAPHVAISSRKTPIKAHLLLLILQKTARESAFKL